MISHKAFNLQQLIDRAYKPEDWMNHLNDDLLKFWNKPEITDIKDSLFPTYITNDGHVLPASKQDWPKEFVEAKKSSDTSGLVDEDNNYVRAHSRLTYAFGIAYHMTGKTEYLDICKKGAMELMNAMDGNYGMHVTQNSTTKEWDSDYRKRTSQDLAYGLTGLGMYYFLTHDKSVMFKILQLHDYIFNVYMDEKRGYLTWLPRFLKDNPEVQIVAQLDQLYAYMLMITPALPMPYAQKWRDDMKQITDILITQFYSEQYGFFWGVDSDAMSMNLGTDHTDFGHSVKTFWVILKVGELLNDVEYINFARPKIHRILLDAYIEKNGSWARRFDQNGNLDIDKEWWILAELDQAAEILSIHDPSYYRFLNNTHKYWFDVMTDHEHGEIWHMVDGATDKPVINYPKAHNWKTSLHSFEHTLFGYMTASRVKNESFSLFYAIPEWEKSRFRELQPYMFRAKVLDVENEGTIDTLTDGNSNYKVTFTSLH